jgi:hypothetical protein
MVIGNFGLSTVQPRLVELYLVCDYVYMHMPSQVIYNLLRLETDLLLSTDF